MCIRDRKKILVRNIEKAAQKTDDPSLLTNNWKEIVDDPEIEIVIELIGGIEPARKMCIRDRFTTTVRANRLNFMAVEDIPEEIGALGKIRYNHRGDTCKVKRIGEDLLECHFDTPVRAVTPGQALVLYQGEYVLGGGTIV